jgi:RHS repeat-associated protein
MNADGSNQARLTNTLENDDSPTWSSDGTKIAFRSDRERECCDPTNQVWVMNANGTNAVDLSNNWFGDYNPSWSNINAPPPPPNGAQFISQSVPQMMTAGQSYSVSITMKNTGSNTWTTANHYNLGSQNAQDNTTWGTARVALPSSVVSGSQVTFNFTVTAPATSGTYNFQWRMVQGGVEWFGDFTPNIVVTVNAQPGGNPSPEPDPSTPVADVRWIVADQLGTPRMILDQSGSLANVSRHDYLPFGEELTGQIGARTTQQGYTGDSTRQKFTQKERDIETGLDFFEARYYASMQGRFTSVDALLSSGVPGEPQSWNRYSYTINNPLKFIDPSGLIWVYQDSPGIRSFRWYDDAKDVPKGWTEYTEDYYDGADGRYYLNPNGPEGSLHKRDDGFGFNYNWDPYVRNGWAKGPTPAQYEAYMAGGAIKDDTWDIIGLLVLRGPKGRAIEEGLTAKATEEALEAIPKAANLRLQRTIDALFQTTDRLPGGTAGAIRHELETGELVGGSSHLIKGADRIRNLERIMRTENLSPADRATAQRLIHDLQDALKGK